MMAVTINTSDGGYVEAYVSGEEGHVQKFTAGGDPVAAEFTYQYASGDPTLLALAGGGYLVVDPFNTPYFPTYYDYDFSADGQLLRSFNGISLHPVASPAGGFVETFHFQSRFPPPVTPFTLNVYGASGVQLMSLNGMTGDNSSVPSIGVQSDGRYLVSWSDGFRTFSDTFDPSNFVSPAVPGAPALSGIDNVSPVIGIFGNNAVENDPHPVLRVGVSQLGQIYIDQGGFEHHLEVTITDADVARGYAEVQLPFAGTNPSSNASHSIQVLVSDPQGFVGPTAGLTFTVDTTAPAAPSLTILDDQGPQTGSVPDGGVTDDNTPNIKVAFTGTGNAAAKDGDTVQLYDNGQPLGAPAQVFHDDPARGYIQISGIVLSNGQHALTAVITDAAGNVGPTSNPTHFTVAAESGGAPTLSIAPPDPTHEGTSGQTDFAFTVTRTGDASASALADYYLAYGGTADSSDFAGPTAGTVYFDPGQTSAVIHIAVAGDTDPEGDETFTIAMSNGRGASVDPNHGSATATILDGAGGSSAGSSSVSTSDPDYTAPSGVHTITLTGTSSQTVHGNNEGDAFWSNNNANTLIGGTGDDIFHLGRNGDVATGGGGNDTFAFAENPWSPAGRITDFNAGDVIDLTETLHRAGYSSGDPVAEGYVKFVNDSSGNAQVWFDPDPGHSATFWLVTGLDGVDAASLHANAGLITI